MQADVIRKRIAALRALMKEHGLDAYYVPGTDPHMSEYIPLPWRRREWISGFTGSHGDVVITATGAGLWTDGRYFLQAAAELKDTGITLYKEGVKDEVSIKAWLSKALKQEAVVGVDPRLLSCQGAHDLMEELEKGTIRLNWLEDNLVDRIWTERPAPPAEPVVLQPLAYTGEPAVKKLAKVRAKMREEGAQVYVLDTLDSLAWLFNIRGRDSEYNPVVIAYAIITLEEAFCFVRSAVLTPSVSACLQDYVQVKEYTEFKEQLLALGADGSHVCFDPNSTNYWIEALLKDKSRILYKDDPVNLLKAVKNETEIAGFKRAHVRDGAALVRFLYWLEQTMQSGTATVTELTACAQLLEFRREQALFQFPSFATIAAYGEHGAIIHYSPGPAGDIPLKPAGLFLLDSGGQYLDGTTDVTRTVALGPVTKEEQAYYTYVLKGYINLATASFPETTRGIQLDTLARKFLWDKGADYGHGTGHGVGSYLGVHEGPQSISAARKKQVALEAGMFLSLEPGYYRPGKFGIRLENLAVIVRNEQLATGEQVFFTFDVVTLCPFARDLILVELLTDEERAYIDAYHRRVYEALTPALPAAELAWLKAATEPL